MQGDRKRWSSLTFEEWWYWYYFYLYCTKGHEFLRKVYIASRTETATGITLALCKYPHTQRANTKLTKNPEWMYVNASPGARARSSKSKKSMQSSTELSHCSFYFCTFLQFNNRHSCYEASLCCCLYFKRLDMRMTEICVSQLCDSVFLVVQWVTSQWLYAYIVYVKNTTWNISVMLSLPFLHVEPYGVN